MKTSYFLFIFLFLFLFSFSFVSAVSYIPAVPNPSFFGGYGNSTISAYWESAYSGMFSDIHSGYYLSSGSNYGELYSTSTISGQITTPIRPNMNIYIENYTNNFDTPWFGQYGTYAGIDINCDDTSTQYGSGSVEFVFEYSSSSFNVQSYVGQPFCVNIGNWDSEHPSSFQKISGIYYATQDVPFNMTTFTSLTIPSSNYTRFYLDTYFSGWDMFSLWDTSDGSELLVKNYSYWNNTGFSSLYFSNASYNPFYGSIGVNALYGPYIQLKSFSTHSGKRSSLTLQLMQSTNLSHQTNFTISLLASDDSLYNGTQFQCNSLEASCGGPDYLQSGAPCCSGYTCQNFQCVSAGSVCSASGGYLLGYDSDYQCYNGIIKTCAEGGWWWAGTCGGTGECLTENSFSYNGTADALNVLCNLSASCVNGTFQDCSTDASSVDGTRQCISGVWSSCVKNSNIPDTSTGSSSNSFLNSIAGSFISLFPNPSTMSLLGRLSFVFITMLFVSILVLFLFWKVTGGVSSILGWVLFILNILLLLFFIVSGYIPIALWLGVLLIVIALLFLKVKSGGG